MKIRTYLAAGALVGASLSYFDQLAREAYHRGYKAGRIAGTVSANLAAMEPDAGPPAACGLAAFSQAIGSLFVLHGPAQTTFVSWGDEPEGHQCDERCRPGEAHSVLACGTCLVETEAGGVVAEPWPCQTAQIATDAIRGVLPTVDAK